MRCSAAITLAAVTGMVYWILSNARLWQFYRPKLETVSVLNRFLSVPPPLELPNCTIYTLQLQQVPSFGDAISTRNLHELNLMPNYASFFPSLPALDSCRHSTICTDADPGEAPHLRRQIDS